MSAVELAGRLRSTHGRLNGRELLAAMREAFPHSLAVISSFGAEAAVLLDMVAQVDKTIPVIFLDTGELFEETLAYQAQLTAMLGLADVRVIKPQASDLGRADGLWRTDPDACCRLRKVLPLGRATPGLQVLVDGRKRIHGGERATVQTIEAGEDEHRQNLAFGRLEPRTDRGRLHGPRAAAPSAGWPRLSVDRLFPLLNPDRNRRAHPRRPLGGHAKDRMRHTSDRQIVMTSDLDALENQSIFILREAFNRIDKVAMLWSIGKDSNVMLWLARKAFFGHVPFPVCMWIPATRFPR